MPLPAEIQARSREEWLSLAQHTDPVQRRIVSDALRKIGHDPMVFVAWKPEVRVEKILEAQGDAAPSSAAAAPPATGVKTEAAPLSNGQAGPATTTAGRKKTESKTEAAPSATVSVDLSPVLAGIAASNASIAAMQAEIVELRRIVEAQSAFVRDAHMMVSLFFATNPDAKANLEDPDMRSAFYGRLIHEVSPSGNG